MNLGGLHVAVLQADLHVALLLTVDDAASDERSFLTVERAADDADVAFDPRAFFELQRSAEDRRVADDTSAFAVESIRRWWRSMGQSVYPQAKRLLICADGGGSNGYRVRLWKKELQRLSDQLGLSISVCHYPPGTSKWNKIEHRVFCHITRNWQGVPLETLEVVVESIGATTTTTGLEVHAWLDDRTYEKGRKVSDEELAQCNIVPNKYHGEWNYELHPRERSGIR